jgi:AcrR family transcriptional regulator
MRLRKPAEQRREEIILATLSLASRQGPDQVTTEAVAAEIGITQAAVFRHFPRKADIWEAVIGWLRDRMVQRWCDAAPPHLSPPPRLRAVLAAQFIFIDHFPALPALLLSQGLDGKRGTVREGLLGIMGTFKTALSAILAEGRADGHFRTDLDVDRAASVLLAVAQGTAVRWSLMGRRFDLTAEGLAAVDLVLDGLRPACGKDGNPG